jgi:hypothetical protein
MNFSCYHLGSQTPYPHSSIHYKFYYFKITKTKIVLMSLDDILVCYKSKIEHFKHFKTIWTYGGGGENTMMSIINIMYTFLHQN